MINAINAEDSSSNILCISHVQKGTPCIDLPSNKVIEVSIVVIRQQNILESINGIDKYFYLQNLQNVMHKFTVIELKIYYRDLDLLQWLTDTSSSVPSDHLYKKYILLFLSLSSIRNYIAHDFEGIFQSVLESGFSCV